jgi:putative MATE family efflux protein
MAAHTSAGASRAAPLKLLPIAAPLLLELALGMAVGLVGTALAARLGDASAAGFAMAHHVFGSLFVVFRIVGAGLGVVVTQALGAGRRDAAERVARAALAAASAIGLVAFVVAATLGRPLLALLNAPPEVVPQAARLLAFMAPALLLDAWVATGTAVLRAHLHARHTLRTMVAMHGLHLALMAPLMFGFSLGPLGLPGFGLVGFALALLASRVLAGALLAWHWRHRLGIVPSASDFWRPRPAELRAIARIGVPGAAENIAYRLASMVSVAVAGSLGAAAVATHAYVFQLMLFVMLVGLATGLAVEIVVGHHIGAGRLRQADALVRRSLKRGLAASVVAATLAALAGPWLQRQFTHDEAIVRQGVLLWLTVLLEPGRTFNLVVINGLRAAGDARYPVAVGAVSMALVLAGGSWLLGRVAGLGLVGIWIAYAADEWLRGLLMWRRWRRLHWLPHARESRRRLRRQPRAGTVSGQGAAA